jgi:flagellar biosynthetic protein FliR
MNDLLVLAWNDLLPLVFVFIRVGAVFTVVPFFGSEIMPRRITALIALFLSLIILPVTPPVAINIQSLTVLSLLMYIVHEILLGISMGLAVQVIFVGMQIAGELMGFSMGFAIVNVIDPLTGTEAPVTSNFLYLTAFLLFIVMDGHHMFIRAIQESFTMAPIGMGLPKAGFYQAALTYAAGMFLIGLKLAAPVIGAILLVNVSLGLIARSIPQMNIFIVSFPVLISIGLFFMIIIIKAMPFFLQGPIRNAWQFITASMKLF